MLATWTPRLVATWTPRLHARPPRPSTWRQVWTSANDRRAEGCWVWSHTRDDVHLGRVPDLYDHNYILPTPIDAPAGGDLSFMLWLHVDAGVGDVPGRMSVFTSADLELAIIDGALS